MKLLLAKKTPLNCSFFFIIGVVLFIGVPTNASEKKTKAVPLDPATQYIKGKQLALEGKHQEAAALLESALKADPESSHILHELSEVYLRLGDFEKAASFGEKAVKKEPDNIEFRASLASVYASVRRFDEAKVEYKKIMELDPADKRAPFLLGVVEAENGELEKSLETLTLAIKRNPEFYMGYFYRAKIYLELEKVAEAKDDLAKSMELQPAFIEAGSTLGLLYERLGETDKAVEIYAKIPGTGRFKKRLANIYIQKNQLNKALEELLAYEQTEPDDYTTRVRIALIYNELKQFDKAAQRLKTILKEEPEADNVQFYLGAVYEQMEKPKEAIAEFKKVSDQSSFYKEAMLHIGFLYKAQGKLSEGIRFAEDLTKKQSGVPEYIDLHASLLEAKGDYKKALSVVQLGLVQFKEDEKLLYFEGALLDKLGDRKKAIQKMKELIAKNGSNPHALNFVGYTYAELGENLDEAEEFVQRALKLRPDDPYFLDSLAWVQFKKGKYDVALSNLEKAIKLQPDEGVILEHLGDVYLKKNEIDKALAAYQKAAKNTKEKDADQMKKIQNKIAVVQKNPRLPSNKVD